MMGWWRLRTVREQRLLLGAAVLLGGMILWLGIWRPLDHALAAARARHARAVLALADARSQAAAIHGLKRVGAPAIPAQFESFAGALAAEAGFAVARIEPQGTRQVNIVIDAARAPALFGWASEIERHGLVVDRLSARANSDATLAAEISIRARGR